MKEAFKYASFSIRSSESAGRDQTAVGKTSSVPTDETAGVPGQAEKGKTLKSKGAGFEVRPEISSWWNGLFTSYF
ncbi:hypothetical protein [Methylophilus rhizosphaerae]|uniref:hypothetical protein n=1 Tax=Methylophilus rhizosphaerae TaxID=492660 RepID=UPI00115F879C|nr:hypothetical protein [Methylophilus rhizosphaerae]